MKRNSLLRHLRKHGCYLKREGREHSLWINPRTGAVEEYHAIQKYQISLPRRSAVTFLFQNHDFVTLDVESGTGALGHLPEEI